MAHQRKLIRQAVRTLLAGAGTAAGSRVSTTRIDTYRGRELPAISIYTPDEAVDPESRTTAPRELTRNVDVEIAGWVAPGDAVDDAMDDLAEQIEDAMDADHTLGGVVGDSILTSTTTALQGEGDKMLGQVVLTYSMTYRTLSPEPPADDDLDDFRTAHTAYDLGGAVHEDNQARDVVVVQEAPP